VPATLKLATQNPRSLSQLAFMTCGTKDQVMLLDVMEQQIATQGCFTEQERAASEVEWW
jgi:hypothetical protein